MSIRRCVTLASLLALTVPATAAAAPAAVDVRVEGRSATIFSGSVITDGKVVTTASGGTHVCDGTNNGASPVPTPTATAALDDAAARGGFTWDGTWSGDPPISYPDYFVTRVAGESENPALSHYWGVFVNGLASQAGGCQTLVEAGDEVLWTYDAFNKPDGALRLTVPGAAQTGQAVVAKVTRIGDGAPVAGATVGAGVTDAAGEVALAFDAPGVYVLKADKPSAIRSREARVCVDPPLVEACTSTDRAAPTVELRVPEIASSTSRSSRVRVAWVGDDGAGGSGIRRYRVDWRRADLPDRGWRSLVADEAVTERSAPAREGAAYEFRVQAFDRAGNVSEWAVGRTVVPLDNLSNRLALSDGWRTLKRHGAFDRSVSRASRPGETARLRFRGTQATLVTRALPRGGRVRIAIDGRARVVSLRGRGRFRQRLVSTARLAAGQHTLRITTLGRAPVEIDAVAIRP